MSDFVFNDTSMPTTTETATHTLPIPLRATDGEVG